MAVEEQKVKDLIIIGTGPAGHTAAIYAARASLDLCVFEGLQPGGQLTTTTEVENFPGFPEGVQGPELMAKMRQQGERFGAQYVAANIVQANLKARPFLLQDQNGKEYQARSLIIATGASAKYLGLPNEMSLIGKGVSACATCDGFFYRNQVVHIVGGGDTALEEANFLTKFAKKVYVVHRRDSFRASKPLQQRTLENPKIEVLWNTGVVEILANAQGVYAIKVENVQTKEMQQRATNGLFVAIGHTPNTKFLAGQLALDDQGYIITQGHYPDTSVPGVFACGDVQDHYYRQAISAAGSGCQAALRAERFLATN